MRLTIGMASYNNPEQVWWTVEALRMYQDLTDCEIVIIDNAGNEALKNWSASWAGDNVRYIERKERRGTAFPRNAIFEEARGEFVLVIDSHVMLAHGSVDALKKWVRENSGCPDLIQGPLMMDDLGGIGFADSMIPKWEGSMFGVWSPFRKELPTEPYEIEMHGLGLFGCFKDKWLQFNPEFQGFGGEEGYIHYKYKNAGRKVLCLPFLKWLHRFHDQLSVTTYPNIIEERIKNYIIGWREIGRPEEEILNHFKGFDINLESLIIKYKQDGNINNI